MGGVSAAPSYIHIVSIGSTSSSTSTAITNTPKQGGIISIYYFGSILGAFLFGYLADHIGRIINAIFFTAIFALVGGALQAAAQNAGWMMGVRVVTGAETGGLMAVVPVCKSGILSIEMNCRQ